MMWIYLEAPFATFRTFTAGWYRPTATFLTPSAAYGLLLNLAGIECRLREDEEDHVSAAPASILRRGLPAAELAIGAPAYRLRGRRRVVPETEAYPRVQTAYQQLHNYPVGTSGAERAESCRGNKYNITPVRREFLTDLRAVVGLRANPELADRIRRGLAGEFNDTRYGVPFLGDNAFLLDRIEMIEGPGEVYWYEQVTAYPNAGPRLRATRLTTWIDRADLSQTRSALFAPKQEPSTTVPDGAWVSINPPAVETKPVAKIGRRKP